MNNMLRNISFGAVLLLVAGTVVTAQEWRGIVSLKSTRQDVERLFGVPKKPHEAAPRKPLRSKVG